MFLESNERAQLCNLLLLDVQEELLWILYALTKEILHLVVANELLQDSWFLEKVLDPVAGALMSIPV